MDDTAVKGGRRPICFAILRYSVASDARRGSLTLVRISVSARLAYGCGLPSPSTPRIAGSLVPRLARNLTPAELTHDPVGPRPLSHSVALGQHQPLEALTALHRAGGSIG